MDTNKTLAEIEKKLQGLNKLYDALRIVDPVNQKVIERIEYASIDKDCVYWHNELLSDDALALRAYEDKKCCVGLEQLSASTLLITALPIDNSLILEMVKNVSDAIVLDGCDFQMDCQQLREEYDNLAFQDELTGLFNRRYVGDCLQKDISTTIYKHQPLSIIFLDIDNLKEINDKYGHGFGDKVLIEVANLLQRSIRENNDWVARYGGDEFLICLNNASDEDAFEIAERIRTEIVALGILQNESIKTSASLGICTTRNKKVLASELISLADSKMYQAKRNGKNQTAR
ncbi:GGDEF domain-containing protein [Gudongella oleilytica]|uniref:GGDEF domain-containing protein n=1 Tax=Gudongella oleilytica TaxID=1582259 RepID=UPI000FF89A85|nr:GGDEF domain-containing protein [Gudongella oleilytica]